MTRSRTHTPPRSSRTRSAVRRAVRPVLLVSALALVVFAPGDWRGANAQLPAEDVEEAKARLAEVYDPVQALQEELDRTRFDLDELSLELAFEDAEAIARHVHDAVRFEPYEGLLRGAEGTLASGGGNALDQALLTTTLLWDAGYEAEIVRAELDDEGVSRVLATMRVDAEAPLWEDGEASRGPDAGDAADLERAVRERLTTYQRDANAAQEALSAALSRGRGDEAMERVRDTARDYFWVQYRWSEDEPWQDAHPVFGEAPEAIAALEPEARFTESIPAELQHRLRVQAFVEQRMGDELEVHAVMDPWERPVANLYGVPVSYGNVPDGLMAADDPTDMAQVRDGTSFFFPMLMGDLAPGAKAFEMNGNVTIPEAAQSPFGAIFQSVGSDLGEAAGALGAIGFGAEDEDSEDAADFVALTAHWLEFTLIRPGGEEVTHRRMITDRRGAAAREADDVRLQAGVSEDEAFDAIASTHGFMTEPGRYGEGYVTDRGLEALLGSRELAEATLDAMAQGGDLPPPSEAVAEHQNTAGALWLFDLFHDAPGDDAVMSYRPEPGLVVLSHRLDGEGAAIDVVANPRWSFRADEAGVRFDPAATLAHGTWETRVEGVALPEEAPAIPAFAALEGAGGALQRAEPGDEGAVATFDAPAEARAAMREDVRRGYAVLAPRAMSTDPAAQGWWRVDPVTGETLGRGGDGRGQASSEYSILTISVPSELSWAMTAGFSVHGVHQCTKIEDSAQAGCCIVENLAMAAGGMAIGAGLALKGADGIIAFAIMDVGVNTAGAAGAIPSFCGT